MVQQTEKFSNLLAYFEWALPQIVIAMDSQNKTVAWVPTTSSNDPYTVWIDESGKVPCATKCSCDDCWYRKSYCKHMQVADLYFQQIAEIFAHGEEESTIEQTAETLNITAEQVAEIVPFAKEYAAHKQMERATFASESQLETVSNEQRATSALFAPRGFSLCPSWKELEAERAARKAVA